jgi:hypothetical protein
MINGFHAGIHNIGKEVLRSEHRSEDACQTDEKCGVDDVTTRNDSGETVNGKGIEQ